MEQRLNSIDGLRAVAMTMVIAQHCGLLPFGWIGVWLFYVISGFVITRGFISEDTKSSHIAKFTRLTSFLKRRAIRIFPAYFGYILLTIVIYIVINGDFSGFTYWGLLTFTYNWQMILGPIFPEKSWPAIGHLWTISVEQQFYLLFPLFFLFVSKKYKWHLMLILVLLGPVIRYFYDILFVIPNFSNQIGESAFSVYAASFCHFDAFLLGALLARYHESLIKRDRLRVYLLLISLLLAFLYCSYYVALNLNAGLSGMDVFRNIVSGWLYGQEKQLWLYSVIIFLSSAIILNVLSGARFTQWLSNSFLSRVGVISYGGYLYHALVLWLISLLIGQSASELSFFSKILNFIGVWIITIAIAHVSYKYFEQPISRAFKK